MALFGKDKKEESKKTDKKSEAKAEVTAVVAAEGTTARSHGLDLGSILIRPHVTEKATDLAERSHVYAFEIAQSANKAQVRQAIEKMFKVKPTKVAIIQVKSKLMKSRKNNQVVLKKPGMKKALVTLKAGDKIEFV
jgi:large subunit ribosomal protein L23